MAQLVAQPLMSAQYERRLSTAFVPGIWYIYRYRMVMYRLRFTGTVVQYRDAVRVYPFQEPKLLVGAVFLLKKRPRTQPAGRTAHARSPRTCLVDSIGFGLVKYRAPVPKQTPPPRSTCYEIRVLPLGRWWFRPAPDRARESSPGRQLRWVGWPLVHPAHPRCRACMDGWLRGMLSLLSIWLPTSNSYS